MTRPSVRKMFASILRMIKSEGVQLNRTNDSEIEIEADTATVIGLADSYQTGEYSYEHTYSSLSLLDENDDEIEMNADERYLLISILDRYVKTDFESRGSEQGELSYMHPTVWVA